MLLNLQLLRAFAALSVVLFHTIQVSESYDVSTNWLFYFEGWGASGVDVFFVISGFVMLYTQLDNKRSVKSFLLSRAVRIVPMYWLLTTFLIVMYFVAPFIFQELIITPDWALASFAFMSKAVTGVNPIVYVGWTLEWEMLFYFVFGISLWFRSWSISLILTTSVLFVFALSVSNFILMEFIAGLFVALLTKKYGFKKFGITSLVLGSILLLISINDDVRETLINSREILWGIPSALIVYGAVTINQANSPFGKLLGDASYSIYLIQIFSIPFFYKLFSISKLGLDSDFLAIICILSTAIGGVVMYLIIEKPITKFIRKTLQI